MANEEIRLANMENVLHTAITLMVKYGIQNTTREMIARASGLSRRSTERYFPAKVDWVVQAAEWFGHDLYSRFKTPKLLDEGNMTAREILLVYLSEMRNLLLREPQVFVCYAEFKAFLYRNSEDRYGDYMKFADAVGCRKTLQRIYELGDKDGSIRRGHYSAEAAARYATNTLMSYFTNAVLLYDTQPEVMKQALDDYISDAAMLYCGGRDYTC